MVKKQISISPCMIVLNEEKSLSRVLKSVSPYVDEIIIVDGGSIDKTVEIAKKFNAKVVANKWEDHYANQRNLAIKHARGKWILFIDADEVFEKKLLKKLKLFVQNNIGIDAFAFSRKNYINNKQTLAYPDRQIRFFLNNGKIKYKGRLHEQPIGWVFGASPTNLHIIHRKALKRQKEQNIRYKQMEKKHKKELTKWYEESYRTRKK